MKARIKLFEDMPDSVKCCTTMVEVMQPYCGMEVNVFRIPKEPSRHCPFCGALLTGVDFQVVGSRVEGYSGNMLDIDEGCEEPMRKEVTYA